jgi:hypothetical protein
LTKVIVESKIPAVNAQVPQAVRSAQLLKRFAPYQQGINDVLFESLDAQAA